MRASQDRIEPPRGLPLDDPPGRPTRVCFGKGERKRINQSLLWTDRESRTSRPTHPPRVPRARTPPTKWEWNVPTRARKCMRSWEGTRFVPHPHPGHLQGSNPRTQTSATSTRKYHGHAGGIEPPSGPKPKGMGRLRATPQVVRASCTHLQNR